jgi:hypothetical protein
LAWPREDHAAFHVGEQRLGNISRL